MKVTTKKLREGRIVPKLCNGNVATGLVSFSFGCEDQDIFYCTKTSDLVKTTDSAIFNTDDSESIYAARYRALPAKEDGVIYFDSTISMVPKMYKCRELTGTVIEQGQSSPATAGDATSNNSGCFEVVDASTPDLIVDLSSYSLEMTNQGVYTASVTITAKKEAAGRVGSTAMNLFNRDGFTGQISAIDPAPALGTDYLDYRVTARGIVGSSSGEAQAG